MADPLSSLVADSFHLSIVLEVMKGAVAYGRQPYIKISIALNKTIFLYHCVQN